VNDGAKDISSGLSLLDSESSNLRWIQTWLKDIAEKSSH
jgi:hypothetical protein